LTNAQEIFDTTMAMMDEVREDGSTDNSDTREYKNRTLPILNILRGELYPYSDTYDANDAGRSISARIKNFTSSIDLDDYICQTVMPYGLAAHLLTDENPSLAGFYQQRYEELVSKLARGLPAVSEDIEDVCFGGGNEYTEFGRW